MNQYIVQYMDGGEVKQVVMAECADLMEAIAKFKAQYGELEIVGVTMAGRL